TLQVFYFHREAYGDEHLVITLSKETSEFSNDDESLKSKVDGGCVSALDNIDIALKMPLSR
ncbi:hypothetical protein GcM3_200030, partial [Golovinomyces cichoracearum]